MSNEKPTPIVLVVEDDEDTREALAEVLQQAGYTVAQAQDGVDALRQLRAGLPANLIILDINLPRMNGRQFRVEQVVDPRLEHIPVVACSGHNDAYAASVRLGAVACLRKPFSIDQLLEIVREHCVKH